MSVPPASASISLIGLLVKIKEKEYVPGTLAPSRDIPGWPEDIIPGKRRRIGSREGSTIN